jgi:hypothetical protein
MQFTIQKFAEHSHAWMVVQWNYGWCWYAKYSNLQRQCEGTLDILKMCHKKERGELADIYVLQIYIKIASQWVSRWWGLRRSFCTHIYDDIWLPGLKRIQFFYSTLVVFSKHEQLVLHTQVQHQKVWSCLLASFENENKRTTGMR